MIYVTHDQVEAMTMGDRICVMKDAYHAGRRSRSPCTITRKTSSSRLLLEATDEFFQRHDQEGQQFSALHRTNENATNFVRLAESPCATDANHIENHYLRIRPEDIHDSLVSTEADPTRTNTVRVEVSEPMAGNVFVSGYRRDLVHRPVRRPTASM